MKVNANEGQMWHHGSRTGREQKDIRDTFTYLSVLKPSKISSISSVILYRPGISKP